MNPERKDKVNILMVDDQPAKLLSYEAILADLGENLIKANSGREAMEVLLKNDVAVVLMDVSMPELDGFELADIIRQHPRFEKTAIIFISAVHLTDIDRLKGYQRGAVDYISVPVVPELLRAKVSVFAELHRKNRALEILNFELRCLSGRLIAAQDDERRRLAREMHDGFGQDLIATKMALDRIAMANDCPTWSKETATNASELIGGVIQQVRSMSHLLHPPLLDEVGLKSALEWYVDGLTKRSGMEVSTDIQPGDFPRLAAEMETTIFRIIQEALTNVLRHSGANKVTVSLIDGPNRLTVAVRDNGKGISDKVMEFRPDGVGIGIGGMRQRVKEFGGELKITNAHPGTLVEVSIPSNLIFRKETTATA
ncbi:MAG TPA: response regulator [Terriglobales bacterium]|nr:response regulator [Terriglobales bacterium]HZP31811.1 response regulator [Candidatus Acidoferrales bacterium]